MKSKKPVSKKPVTTLNKIETLLSEALKECSAVEKSVEKKVREVLGSAQASVISAKDYIVSAIPSSGAGQKGAKSVSKAKPAARAKKRSAAPAVGKRAAKA